MEDERRRRRHSDRGSRSRGRRRRGSEKPPEPLNPPTRTSRPTAPTEGVEWRTPAVPPEDAEDGTGHSRTTGRNRSERADGIGSALPVRSPPPRKRRERDVEDEEEASEEGVEFTLGRTSGVLAAGAWAAGR